MRLPTKTLKHYFFEKVSLPNDDGCMLWTGAISRTGYGSFRSRTNNVFDSSHRLAYLLWVGDIPEGLQLDHLCRNRACVNPDHLEPVTPRINVLRGKSISAANSRKTECVNGHPFDTRSRTSIGRYCKPCKNERAKKRYASDPTYRQRCIDRATLHNKRKRENGDH